MSKFSFSLKRKEVLDKIRDPMIYEFNLARNLALLSNDLAVIRRFYQIDVMQYFQDPWITSQISDTFMRSNEPGQAYAYFGIIPMIVQGKVNLVASSGFKCKSEDKELDDILNKARDEAKLQELFTSGVYWESGIGDLAYRLSYDPNTSKRPLIDVIEPHHLEVNYNRGKVISYVIKEVSDEDPRYELHEIHYLNQQGYLTIAYRYMFDGEYVATNDEALLKDCRAHFVEVDTSERILPFRDFATVVYKQNANSNKLYKGERGVPDIQGLDTIEDALTESISDLMDAIRKGGVKEYIDDQLIPQDSAGKQIAINPFNKRIITTRGSASTENSKRLWQVTQADIRWQSYVETIQVLMSTAINKAGLSPTTIGLTGLESINSSAESQEAREKTSIRTRDLCLASWRLALTELLNKYLRIMDYIEGREAFDYSDVIKIQFDDYISPSPENVTEILAKQVDAGLKSRETAIMDLNSEYDEDDAQSEMAKIMAESGELPVLTEDVEQVDSVGIPPEINGNSQGASVSGKLGVATIKG